MKKILACMSLVFVLSAGATALADETVINSGAYDSSENSLDIVDAGASKMNTILITDEAGTDILFADQNDEGLGSVQDVTKFLLKGTGKLKAGTYTVKMHDTETGTTKTNTFTVAEGAPDRVKVATQGFKYEYTNKSTGKEEYDIGFKAAATDLSGVHFIAVTVTDGVNTSTVYFGIGTEFTAGSSAAVAIKIKNVPKDVTVSVALTATNGTSN